MSALKMEAEGCSEPSITIFQRGTATHTSVIMLLEAVTSSVFVREIGCVFLEVGSESSNRVYMCFTL
jgi:hypothetical protein